ncbi:hypothetical protein DSL92_06970 [Billgrantia gudaonensis]|uniref:Uncharacterized protein n=1 Tax=Billgrantia gudaonensis TaxID=376427 RepID=A0A3S0R4S2_9GAMM|nr:hypothetical protein DSL92_06970 [Halomonas gudaonensis]
MARLKDPGRRGDAWLAWLARVYYLDAETLSGDGTNYFIMPAHRFTLELRYDFGVRCRDDGVQGTDINAMSSLHTFRTAAVRGSSTRAMA